MTKPRRPPAWLSAAEKRAWRDLVADLGAASEGASGAGLEAAACQLARMRWARGRVEEEGEIVLDARDRPIAHPALGVEFRAQGEVRRWIDSLSGGKRAGAGRPVGAVSAPDRVAEPPRVTKLRAVR